MFMMGKVQRIQSDVATGLPTSISNKFSTSNYVAILVGTGEVSMKGIVASEC
jgi:hypothetical protein